MSMQAYARHLLQEVVEAVPPAAPTPSPSTHRLPSFGPGGEESPFNVNSQFSPTMVIILVILLSAFFFMGFFAVYVRRCASEDNTSQHGNTRIGASRRHNAAAGLGLDLSVVESFPMVSYAAAKRKGCKECVVCLTNFERGEELKQLPKCKHVFHPECIGMWLESHTTCPLCRQSLVNIDKWSLSWRWGGSSRWTNSVSSRLNEGESSHSRRGRDQHAAGSGEQRAANPPSGAWQIRVPRRNGDDSFHASGEGIELADGGSPYAIPLSSEMGLPSSAPSALLASPSLEIVGADSRTGCMPCRMSEVVGQGSSGLVRNNGTSRDRAVIRRTQGGTRRLCRSNSTGHSLRREVISKAAAVAMQAVPLVGCIPALGQSTLHRSRSIGVEERQAMVGPDVATSDQSIGSCGGPATTSTPCAQ